MASNTNLALEDRPLRHVEGVAQALMPLSVARTDLVDELSATGSGRVQAWRIARGEIDPDIDVDMAMHIIQGPLISMRIVANDEVGDHDLETMLDMTVKALGATHGQTDARTLMAAPLAQRSSVKTRWGLHTIDRPLASPMR